MPTNLTRNQWAELTDALMPTVRAWIGDHEDVLSAKGRAFAEKALAKAALGGHAGTRQLFEPVLLIMTAAEPVDLDQLLDVCDRIPFSGDYRAWDYVRGAYAAADRILLKHGETQQARRPWLMLSYPENGEQPLDPFATLPVPVTNRVNGRLLSNALQYPRPATSIAALQHVLWAVREMTIMWALGGSETWPQHTLDQEIGFAMDAAAAFVTR